MNLITPNLSTKPWLPSALQWHSWGMVLLLIAACIAGHFGLGTQSPILAYSMLAIGTVFIGFPHGAFDHWVAARRWASQLGRQWWLLFLAAYLGLTALVLLGWAFAPAVTLSIFLVMSVVHFGLGDVEDGLAPPSVPYSVAVFVRGGTPILLPLSVYPEYTTSLLASLTTLPAATLEPAIRTLAPPLCIPWLLGLGWFLIASLRVSEKDPKAVSLWRVQTLELLLQAGAFIWLPPLLALALYFCFGHSVRHVLRLGAWHAPLAKQQACRWLLRTLAPAAVLCAIGLGVLWWLYGRGGEALPVFSIVVRLIAALTLPHMVVCLWLSHRPQR